MSRLPALYLSVLVLEAAALGWRYATAPPASSDPLNVWLGWGGLISMVAMLVYSIARRSARLKRIARLSTWLHLHIFLGLQGALLVGFHCAPLFLREAPIRWLNPAALNMIAVFVVFCSGLFGRYLYTWLPRTLGGEQMEARDVERELAALQAPLLEDLRAFWTDLPPARGFAGLIQSDIATRRALRHLAQTAVPDDQRALARRRVVLERRKAALAAALPVFRNWIVLHRPLAATMYVLSAVHVVLSYMFAPSLGG